MHGRSRPSPIPSLPRCWAIVAGLAWMLASGPGGAGALGTSPTESLLPVTTPKGRTLWVEHADTTEKRARGLMFRTTLPKDRGMLFTFGDPQHWTIWMKNTWIPLDIIWLDARKRIVHIEANVPPCHRTDNGCPQYQPIRKAVFVLEVAGGVAEELGLEKGTRLTFPIDPPAYLLR